MIGSTYQSLCRLIVPVLFSVAVSAAADDKLDGLVKNGKFAKVIEHVEKSIPPAERSVEVWLQYADALDKTGADKQKVIKAFVEAQKVHPSDPRIFAVMGEFYLKDKKYEEAMTYLQKWYLLSRNARAAEAMATCAMNLKQYNKARDAAESAVMLDKNAIEARKVLSYLFFNEKDWANAAEQLEAIVAADKEDVTYWKKLAFCYEELKKHNKVITAAKQIVSLDSKDTHSRKIMAEYYLEKKDTKSALPLLKELAVLLPNDAEIFRHLYQISLANKQQKDAVLYLRNYLIIDTTDAEAFKTLGDLLLEQKNKKEALIAYRKAARIKPSIPGLYRNYLTIVLNKKLDDEAIAIMPKTVAAGEADASMYAAVGNIYKKKKDCGKAIGYYQSALKIDMKNLGVLSALAECQAATGKTSDALLNYQQVVMLNPAANQEYKEIGDLLSAQKKNDEAIKNYRKYLEKSPGDEKVASIVGLYYHAKKQCKEALPFFEKIKSSKLLTRSLLMTIGECQYATGNYPKTIEYLSKARTMKPRLSDLKSLLKPLAEAYEKTGDLKSAASTYEGYVKLKGVSDPDASFKQASLREPTDKAGAIALYQVNIKTFPKDARNYVRLGILLSDDKKQVANAIIYLQKAASLTPGDTIVLQTLCDVYHDAGNKTKELSTAVKLTTLQPGNLTAQRRAGTITYGKKQYAAAVPYLEKVYAGAPKDTAIILMLANAYMESKNPKKAMTLYQKASELQPENIELWLSLIAATEAAGDKEKAKEYKKSLAAIDKKIISKNSKEINARLRLAGYLYEKKDFDGAFPIFKDLAKLTPKDTLVVTRLLDISRKKGKNADALTYLRKYVALNGKNAKAHAELGKMLYDRKNSDGALTEFRTALKLDSTQAGFLKQYGTILIAKNLDNEAITVLNLAIKRKEADANSWPTLGNLYRKKKMYPQAIAMYKKASTDAPKNLELLTALGECQAANNDIAGAVLSLEQVVMLNPNAGAEYKTLGSLQMKQKKTEHAIKSYRKYLEKIKNDDDIAKTVGLYLYGQKQYKDAVNYLEMVKNAKLHNRKYLLSLGDSYYQLKNCDKVCSIYSKLHTKKAPEKVLRAILRPLGECYEKTNNPAKAAEAYAGYVALPRVTDTDASYLRAFLIEKSDPKTAVTYYLANIKLFPKDSRSFTRLGMLYAETQATYSKAADMLTRSSQLNPKDSNVLLKLASVWSALKNSKKELEVYKKLLVLDPTNVEVNKRAGKLLIDQKRYKEAVASLEIVRATDPGNVEILMQLADAYLKTNRKSNAIELLTKVHAVQKDNADLMLQLYTIYSELGKKTEAEEMIKKLIELKSESRFRLMYASDLLEQKRYEEVIMVVGKVIKKEPMNLEALMLQGKAQAWLKKYDDAAETFKMATYVKEDYAPAYLERAEIYRRQNNCDRADTYFTKALELDPKLALAELGLARCAKAANKSDEFTAHLKKAKQLDPANAEILAEEKELTPSPKTKK